MRTLYNTSVPVAFEVVYACKVIIAIAEKLRALAPYWVYNGKLLIDIYNEKYQPEDSVE